jgi:hypothetical protein
VRDAFAAEVVKLSPPLLKMLDLSACHNLHMLVLSPQVHTFFLCPCQHFVMQPRCASCVISRVIFPVFSAELYTLLQILLRSYSATYQPTECCMWVTTDSAEMMLMLQQGACPSLETLNLSSCPGLEYVLVQSSSLTQINLSNCGLLNKVTAVNAGCCHCQWRFPLPCVHVDVANM